ncbi:hypothetical protein WDV94_16160 [Clavibacter tessellarius]
MGQQTGRGLQVESTAALYHLWRIVAGDDRYRVYDDLGIITFQVAGPGVDAVAAALTPIMVGVVLVVTLLGIRAHHRGASPAALMGPLSLALVAALIVTNKVGSPQYVSWFAVPIIVMLVHDRHSRGTALAARLGLVVAALTQLVFPYAYMLLIYVVPVMVGVIMLRDLGEIALLGVAVMQLVRLRGTAEDGPARVRAGRAARGRASHAQPVAGAPAPAAAAAAPPVAAAPAAAHEPQPVGARARGSGDRDRLTARRQVAQPPAVRADVRRARHVGAEEPDRLRAVLELHRAEGHGPDHAGEERGEAGAREGPRLARERHAVAVGRRGHAGSRGLSREVRHAVRRARADVAE